MPKGKQAVLEPKTPEITKKEETEKPTAQVESTAIPEVQSDKGILVLFNRMEKGKLGSTAVEIGFLPGAKDTFDEGVRSIKKVIQGTLSSTTTGGLLNMEEVKADFAESLRFWNQSTANDKLRTELWQRPSDIEQMDFALLCRTNPALREASRVIMDLIYGIVQGKEMSLSNAQLDSLWAECVAHLAQFTRDNVDYIRVYFMPMDQERLFPPPNRGGELIAQGITAFYGEEPSDRKTQAFTFLWSTGITFLPKMDSKVRGEFLDTIQSSKASGAWSLTADPRQIVTWMAATLYGTAGHVYADGKPAV